VVSITVSSMLRGQSDSGATRSLAVYVPARGLDACCGRTSLPAPLHQHGGGPDASGPPHASKRSAGRHTAGAGSDCSGDPTPATAHGGAHKPTGLSYEVWQGAALVFMEAGWSGCTTCFALFWGNGTDNGVCPFDKESIGSASTTSRSS
jgi:hypothetical protein